MGHSRLVADRMLLDLKALVISLKFLTIALENKKHQDAQMILQSIKNDIQRIQRAPRLVESYEIIYHNYDTLQIISEILKLIEENKLPDAVIKIDKLNNKLGADSRESFSSPASYPEIRPLGF